MVCQHRLSLRCGESNSDVKCFLCIRDVKVTLAAIHKQIPQLRQRTHVEAISRPSHVMHFPATDSRTSPQARAWSPALSSQRITDLPHDLELLSLPRVLGR